MHVDPPINSKVGAGWSIAKFWVIRHRFRPNSTVSECQLFHCIAVRQTIRGFAEIILWGKDTRDGRRRVQLSL
jgi:hypothetical protein